MEFKPLERRDQLGEINSSKGYTVIFKHNTTCPISRNVRRHFEMEAEQLKDVKAVYLLDLLEFRELSDAIAEQYSIPHESPQLLLIRDGECTYSESLYNISVDATSKAIGAQH
jgi:bacillithiol system protein YtxJ